MNNDKPIDDIAATLRTWSEKLTVGFAAAGLHCEYHSHTGSSGVRLGRLTVTKPGVDIPYFVDFERKLVIKRGERRLITQLEVFNPVGGLHVHISNIREVAVAKIVAYAKQSIETKQAREALDADRRRRGAAGADIYRREFATFPMPAWARAMPNVESEADTGTFRLLFGDNRSDWPLNRLTPAQVKQVVDAIRAVTCPSEAIKPSPWHTSSEPVPPELVNDPRSYTGITKMLLLCVDFQPSPVRGWYYGGLLNEFRMEGSPSTVKPTHWMPLPEKPEGVCA